MWKVMRQRGSPIWMFAAAMVLLPGAVMLAENVDPANLGNQYAWGENIGWLNAEPNNGAGVTVSDTELTGWIWGENIGWISLSCQNRASCGDNPYGVTNDGKGNLSGFAWNENIGWVNFRTSTGSDCCRASYTPGCTDSACEAAICSADPYCCNNNWDDFCANAASTEPACSPGCAVAPWGVKIHGFTGNFSGHAWAENAGWINFEVGANQIQTNWSCPDPDADAVCSASDNCSTWANPGQGTVMFEETVLAGENAVFFWPTFASVFIVRGEFNSPADIGNYVDTASGSLTGDSFSDVAPPPGTGYWYLLRPNCPVGSYSTGTASEQGDRDGALLP